MPALANTPHLQVAGIRKLITWSFSIMRQRFNHNAPDSDPARVEREARDPATLVSDDTRRRQGVDYRAADAGLTCTLR